ncbi:HisA/HisF-related TIM barrel protein [Desulfovibrio aminophilus]|uniref:imidazole glycerol phosphate synthase subunit HisF n=1 Tax=Desulfovibrio aminophilus TaxID=81425 RepID=UPI0033943557
MNIRVIPRLDIKGPNLVKGIHLEGLRVLGRPEDFARYYYENGADELYYQDAVASLYGRNSLLDIVRKTSREIFIPLCVGGGLRSVDDIRQVLRAGADKVAVNTAAVARPELLREAASAFGSSTIVVSVEAVRRGLGRWEALVDYGREVTGLDAVDWARKAVDLGAGEVMVTSVDQDGTGGGYDLDLVRAIADAVSVPAIAGGGCGLPAHAVSVYRDGHADAVSMATVLHYPAANLLAEQSFSHSYREEGNLEFLKSGKGFGKAEPCTIGDIKRAMSASGIPCRM